MRSTYLHQRFTECVLITFMLAALALILWKLVGLLILIFGAVVGACVLQSCMAPLLEPRRAALAIVAYCVGSVVRWIGIHELGVRGTDCS